MSRELEEAKVLEFIRERRDLEALVEWKVPYAVLFQHVRALVSRGAVRLDGERLTAVPEARLRMTTGRPATRSYNDPLSGARVAPTELEAVRIPGQ